MAGIERKGQQLGSIRVDEDAEPAPKRARKSATRKSASPVRKAAKKVAAKKVAATPTASAAAAEPVADGKEG